MRQGMAQRGIGQDLDQALLPLASIAHNPIDVPQVADGWRW